MKLRLILIGSGLLVVLVLLSLYNTTTIKLVSSDPQAGKTTDYIHPITLKFDHPLSTQTTSHFSIDPAIKGTGTVHDKTFVFTPSEGYIVGATYTAKLKPITKSGAAGQPVSLTFTVNRVTERGLPHDLIRSLPYEAPHFSLDYTINPNSSLNLFITIKGLTSSPSQAMYISEFKQHKQEALTYITSKGGNLDTLNILVADDPEIQEEE